MASLSAIHLHPLRHRSSVASPPPHASAYNAAGARQIALLRSVVASVSLLLSNVVVSENLPEDYETRLPNRDANDRRRTRVLLRPTSLNGTHGIGDFGDQAFRFIDWLSDSGCSIWQVLPLVPPGRKGDEVGSPYSGQDANCGNTLLISLEELVKDGLLMENEFPEAIEAEMIDFSSAANIKDPVVAKAAMRLIASEGELRKQFDYFRTDPNIMSWLEDAAYFAAIDNTINSYSWYEWPEPLKERHVVALEEIHQSKAEFNRKGYPPSVSGVPPDAFSETGQLWGRCDSFIIEGVRRGRERPRKN